MFDSRDSAWGAAGVSDLSRGASASFMVGELLRRGGQYVIGLAVVAEVVGLKLRDESALTPPMARMRSTALKIFMVPAKLEDFLKSLG